MCFLLMFSDRDISRVSVRRVTFGNKILIDNLDEIAYSYLRYMSIAQYQVFIYHGRQLRVAAECKRKNNILGVQPFKFVVFLLYRIAILSHVENIDTIIKENTV